MDTEIRPPTRFARYDAEELRILGQEFIHVVNRNSLALDQLPTEQWTDFVLDWWTETAAHNVLVDGRPSRSRDWRQFLGTDFGARRRYGEFLADLTHSTYPTYGRRYFTMEYWNQALQEPRQVQLALESEWGDSRNSDRSLAFVCEDAAKLGAIRATAKVLLFASARQTPRERIVQCIRRLRDCTDADTPWLWVDVPWEIPHESAEFDVLA